MDLAVSFDRTLLSPELALLATALIVLILDLMVPRLHLPRLVVAVGGVASALVLAIWLHRGEGGATLNDAFVVDEFSLVAKGILFAATLLVLLLGVPRFCPGEYLVLVLLGLFGMSAMCSTRDLVAFVVALETFALCSYLLVGWRSGWKFRAEATLKYFLFGIVSTAVTLYGASLLYGIAGDTSFSAVAAALSNREVDALAVVAVVMTFVGVLFKVAAVPFHTWAPDAYQGAPLQVTTLLATASKVAGFIAIAMLCLFVVPSAHEVWQPLLWVVAALSMIVGNLVALRQKDLVRMLAWSSVGHSGFMLVPLSVGAGGVSDVAIGALFVYAMFYVLGTVGAFACLTFATSHHEVPEVMDSSLVRNGVLGVGFAIALFSLAGLPPFGGWFAKLTILKIAVDSGGVWAYLLAAIVIVTSAVALGYYAIAASRIWRSADEGQPEMQPARIGARAKAFSVIMSAVVVLSGLIPELVTSVGSGRFGGV